MSANVIIVIRKQIRNYRITLKKHGDVRRVCNVFFFHFSELHLCLFCVEKKGWSDTFATSSSYNEHYWKIHQGIIQKNEKRRNEERDKRKCAIKVCNIEDSSVIIIIGVGTLFSFILFAQNDNVYTYYSVISSIETREATSALISIRSS
jgi:hypothetical protein